MLMHLGDTIFFNMNTRFDIAQKLQLDCLFKNLYLTHFKLSTVRLYNIKE